MCPLKPFSDDYEHFGFYKNRETLTRNKGNQCLWCDTNQQLLVCLFYDVDNGIFSLLNWRENRTERKCSILRATSHVLCLPMKLEMMNIAISTCFYKQSHDLCAVEHVNESTLQVYAMNYTKPFQIKSRAV